MGAQTATDRTILQLDRILLKFYPLLINYNMKYVRQT